MRWLVLVVVLVLAALAAAALPRAAHAQHPDLWLEPADTASQGRQEFPRLFDAPQEWAAAASHTNVFFMTATNVNRTPEREVRRQLAFLAARHISLAVGIPGLPVDKHVCGDGVEGMVWPGEVRNLMLRLKQLNADPAYVSFDEPLSYGHFFQGRNACRFSVAETARHLAESVRVIRAAFPNVRIVEAEVPTGKPQGEWERALSEWLADYRAETGEDLYGLSMDVYWHHRWREAIPSTVAILRQARIHVGLYLHADAGPTTTAEQWVQLVRNNACGVRELGAMPDYLIVANWMIKAVKAFPENDPTSLTSVANWAANFDWASREACN
jgi:hypothetical protein